MEKGAENSAPFCLVSCFGRRATDQRSAAMTPVVVMPAMMAPVAMAVPAHLDRLAPNDFVLRNDGELDICRRHSPGLGRDRRHRSGLCACGENDRARDQSGEFQHPKFHCLLPFLRWEREGVHCRGSKMNGR